MSGADEAFKEMFGEYWKKFSGEGARQITIVRRSLKEAQKMDSMKDLEKLPAGEYVK